MFPQPDDTIVALSSAPGGGARAIVRVTGPSAGNVVAAVFLPTTKSPIDFSHRALISGSVRLSGLPATLPADLYFWPAPRTYTGQPLAELHTISSPPLVERLIDELLAAGARPARPGEFTQRAFLAGKKDLPRAEAVLAVIESRTDADLRKALGQLAGGISRPLDRLRNELLDLLADVEAALDFADEGIEFVTQADLVARVGAGIAHLTNLERQLDDRGVSGRPVRVALVGEPNAGKSSLFNALTGRGAAITSPIPGTTRDYLTATLDLGGVTVELIDTAGWQAAADTIEEQAQRLGREQADRADVLLWCVPAGETFNPTSAASLADTGAEVLRVWTKADLPTRDDGTQEIGEKRSGSRNAFVSSVSCLVSVVTPNGTDALRHALSELAVAVARPALAPSMSRCRHHVAAALSHLRSAHEHVLFNDPPELVASALRAALDQIGETAGAVHTDDLLDRIFSRFCIGK